MGVDISGCWPRVYKRWIALLWDWMVYKLTKFVSESNDHQWGL